MFLYESQFMQDMWGSLEIATAPSCCLRIGELLDKEHLVYAWLLRETSSLSWISCLQGTMLETSYLLLYSISFLNIESLQLKVSLELVVSLVLIVFLMLVVSLVLVVSLMLVVSLVLVVSLAEIGPSILMSSLSITLLILI